MGRRYDSDLRAPGRRRAGADPGLNLTGDVIVGFPAEDGLAFARTLAVVEELGFSRLHVFPYSPRPGTPTAPADPCPRQSSGARRALRALSDRLALAHRRRRGRARGGPGRARDPEGACTGTAATTPRTSARAGRRPGSAKSSRWSATPRARRPGWRRWPREPRRPGAGRRAGGHEVGRRDAPQRAPAAALVLAGRRRRRPRRPLSTEEEVRGSCGGSASGAWRRLRPTGTPDRRTAPPTGGGRGRGDRGLPPRRARR